MQLDRTPDGEFGLRELRRIAADNARERASRTEARGDLEARRGEGNLKVQLSPAQGTALAAQAAAQQRRGRRCSVIYYVPRDN